MRKEQSWFWYSYFSNSLLLRPLCDATGSWGFECSRGTKRHVHLHSSWTVPHGHILYWDKEKKRDVNVSVAEGHSQEWNHFLPWRAQICMIKVASSILCSLKQSQSQEVQFSDPRFMVVELTILFIVVY